MLQKIIPDFRSWKQETLVAVATDLWLYAQELEAKMQALEEKLNVG